MEIEQTCSRSTYLHACLKRCSEIRVSIELNWVIKGTVESRLSYFAAAERTYCFVPASVGDEEMSGSIFLVAGDASLDYW